MNDHDDDVNEQLVEFLRREALEDLPVPPDLQAKIERRIEEAFEAKGKMGWRPTAVITAAATLVMGLANQGSFDPAYVMLLAVAAAVYGVGVRQLTATRPPSVQESSA